MEINGVTIQMLPAASGDCIYLEFPDPDFRILIDGGYAKTYHKYLKKFLLNLAAEGKRLNLIVVTHIDKDMIAYKGFQKDLKCRGFQFQEYGINETEKANCRQNGFHCAENPLDCLCYYPNWKNSVYYIVDASGDLDEDGEDSKISCTKMRLLKKIELRSLLLHGAAYMAKYPNRKWNSHVAKENGTSCNGFCIVRGKDPKAKGQKGDLLLLLKEQPGNSQILEIGVICIDGQKYPEETWIDVTGKLVEL